MKEDFVNFELAKLAKEKGFKEPCHYYYTLKGQIGYSIKCNVANKYEVISRPYLADLFKWIISKGFFVNIEILSSGMFHYSIIKFENEFIGWIKVKGSNYFNTYQKTLSDALMTIFDIYLPTPEENKTNPDYLRVYGSKKPKKSHISTESLTTTEISTSSKHFKSPKSSSTLNDLTP